MKPKKNPVTQKNSNTGESHSKIQVVIRVKPLENTGPKGLLKVESDKIIVLVQPTCLESSTTRAKAKYYAFDCAFTPSITQSEVFNRTTKFLISEALNGFNATVFAYGATGSGKTHTMIGSSVSPGLIYNTFTELFENIGKLSTEQEYNVKLSYMEIYNEVVRDLLTPGNDNLDIREDKGKGIIVGGLTERIVTSNEEVGGILRDGSKKRVCEVTDANRVSSRSHAILKITVENRGRGSPQVSVGKLSLIDLAGSERAAKTNNRGMRLIEGANINRSLLALGNCINALCVSNNKSRVHIPYRNSKLTRILKDSLGGNCRTVMIACVSNKSLDYEDIYNTLEYANRAKNIQTVLRKNTIDNGVKISQYNSVMNELKQERKGTNNVENYMNELRTHFKHEVKLKKEIAELDSKLMDTGFKLFSKRSEIDTEEFNGDVSAIKKSSDNIESQIEGLNLKLMRLNETRGNLQNKWKTQVPEPFRRLLQLKLKFYSLKLEAIESRKKDQESKLLVQQKDKFIGSLAEQLNLRDNIINSATEIIKQNNLSFSSNLQTQSAQLKALDQLKSEFFLPLPTIQQQPQSKIPKPTGHYSLKYAAKRILSPRSPLNSPRNALVSGLSTKCSLKVSEKVKLSPYVSSPHTRISSLNVNLQ